MKIWIPFILVCVGLLGVLIWQFTSLDAGSPSVEITESGFEQPVEDTNAPNSSGVMDSEEPTAENVPTDVKSESITDVVEVPFEAVADAQSSSSASRAFSGAVESKPDTTPVKWIDDAADERAAKQRMSELRDVLRDDPGNEAALRTALELARAREWANETCDLLARLVQQRPDDAELHFQLGTQYMLLSRWVEAVSALKNAAQIRPDHVETLYNLAVAHQALGHLADARRTWTRVIELEPANPDSYVHRGEVCLDLRDWSAAEADFARARQLEPQAIDVTLNLALAMTKLGQADEAYELLLPILAEHPRHVPLLNRLAETTWSLYQTSYANRKEMAAKTLEYCERSLALVADQPEIAELRDQARAAE